MGYDVGSIANLRYYRHHAGTRLMIVGVLVLLAIPLNLFFSSPTAEATIVAQWGPSTIQAVASRGHTTCAVADYKAYCWGANTYGQLGNGTTTDSQTPTLVDGGGVLDGKTVTDIALGSLGYACAVADGDAYCWGRNNLSQLGNGTLETDSLIPGLVVNTGALAGKTVTAIATGDAHACAIADQRAYCWGAGYTGRTGTAKTGRLTEPEPVITSGVLNGKDVSQIELGSGHGCVLAEGHVYCWGGNGAGQVGNPAAGAQINEPIEIDMSGVLAGKTMTGLSSGSSNSSVCAIADYQLYCWGQNVNGQLGIGTTVDSPVPALVGASGPMDGKSIVKVSLGNGRAIALDTDGHIYTWGTPPVGNGDSWTQFNAPVAVQGYGSLPGVLTDVAAGDGTCAVGPSHRGLYCWGSNETGEVGDGTVSRRTVPVTVLSSDSLIGSNYRFYSNADSIVPGQPLAGTNTSAQLELANQEFRLRYGIRQSQLSGMKIDIRPSDAEFKLRYAQRTATYCDQQMTGFSDITNTSPIAWNENNSVTNGQQISAAPGDIFSGGVDYQTYQSSPGVMVQTNNIVDSHDGVWDFSLRDNSAPANTDYCLRAFHSDNTPIDSSQYTPMLTTAPSEMVARIVDSDNNTVVSPSYPLSQALVNRNCQTVTGILGTIEQQIQVYNNVTSSGWSLSIASTGGTSATWDSAAGNNHYSYNNPNGTSPGCEQSGPDPGGQLTLNPASATISSPNNCDSTGLSQSAKASFNKGSVDAITLLSGSSSAAIGCQWNLTGIGMEQTIPSYQPAGEYSLNLQLTIVAQ